MRIAARVHVLERQTAGEKSEYIRKVLRQASGQFGQRFPLVFIGLRTNDALIPKSYLAALVFRVSPQSNDLKLFRPHAALPTLLKFRRNAILQTQKFSPNSQLLQQPALHHLSFYLQSTFSRRTRGHCLETFTNFCFLL